MMMRSFLGAAVLGSALALSVVSAPAAASLPAQSTSQSAVTVKVTPRTVTGAIWEFEVVFDTHSQDLNDDPLQVAALVAADGTEVLPLEWKGDAPGSHHRKGVLRFKAPKSSSGPLVLRIRRAGEAAPRTFRWQLP